MCSLAAKLMLFLAADVIPVAGHWSGQEKILARAGENDRATMAVVLGLGPGQAASSATLIDGIVSAG